MSVLLYYSDYLKIFPEKCTTTGSERVQNIVSLMYTTTYGYYFLRLTFRVSPVWCHSGLTSNKNKSAAVLLSIYQ